MSVQAAEEIQSLMQAMLRDLEAGIEQNTPDFVERFAILAGERERELGITRKPYFWDGECWRELST